MIFRCFTNVIIMTSRFQKSSSRSVIQTEPPVHYYEMTRTLASGSGSTEKYLLVHRVRKLSALG
jgi:hypothetical protein